MSSKKRNTPIRVLMAFGVIIIILIITTFFARLSFKKTTEKNLEAMAHIKILEAESMLSSQLALVRQMVRLPSIISYIENPSDEQTRTEALSNFDAYRESFLSKDVFWISDANKEFWSGMQFSYILDPEKPTESWYKMTLNETEEYNFNINYNPQLNETKLWVNVVVRNKNRKPVGIAGTGIPLDDFVEKIYSDIDKNTTMFLYTDGLKVVGAQDHSILKDELNVKQVMADIANVQNLTPTTMSFCSNIHKEIILAPIELLGLHLVISIPCNFFTIIGYVVTPLSICIVVLVVFSVISLFAAFVRLLQILVNAVEKLSSGNADLTARVEIHSALSFRIFDSLVQGLNKFISHLQDIVSTVKTANTDLNTTGSNLRLCTEDTSDSITQIIDNIKNMEHGISTQEQSVGGTSSAVSEISANIESLDRMIKTQSDSVVHASSAVTQMVGNIDSVNQTVQKLSDAFTTLQSKTASGVAKNEEVNNKILKIQEQSKTLANANATISGIASQTSLLAMNAAIEAAHAGETGKGFSVVADEIRKLSENSAEQTKTIGDELKAIEDSITSIVSMSQESHGMLLSVSKEITNTDSLVKEITGAMKEQEIGARELNKVVKLLDDNTREVQSASSEMSAGSSAILDEVKKLDDAMSDIKGGMGDMSASARKISETEKALSSLAQEVDKSISNISGQLDQFKV